MNSRILAVVLTLLAAAPLAAQSASFTGVVRNSVGQPLGDMTVQAYNTAGFPVTAATDPQGRYLLVVQPGSYRLVAFDNNGNYAVSYYGNAAAFEQSEAINVTAGQGFTANFTLLPGLQIKGLVTAAASGAPLQGAVVAAYNLDGSRRTFVSTNADGTYTLTVPQGSYKIVAYHQVSPFIPMFHQARTLFDEATVIMPPASGVNFGLGEGVKLRGTVHEAPLGLPLSGMSVVAYNLQGAVQFRTATNPAGEFAFVLPAGITYKFAVEDPGGNYQTTFYRDAATFESAATITATTNAPLLQFSINRIPDAAPRTTLFIPGVIHSQNVGGGTFFKTDVWIQNPGNAPITVRAAFLRGGQDNSGATGVPFNVPARGQVVLEDVLQSFFGTTGAGALRLEADAPFRATSRTYNEPPNAAQVGTFGLSIPAQSIGASLGRATLTGLVQNGASRTNIGLMNPHAIEINVKIDVFSPTGQLLGSLQIPLPPGDWTQPPVSAFVPVPFDSAYAIVSSTDASFFSYAAVVDAKSGDTTFILPSAD